MSQGGIEYRVAKVSFVNALSTVLTLLFQLIAVPVCLKYWGKDPYGRWLSLVSAFAMLKSLDGGFALYVGNKLNYLYHGETRALREHLSSASIGIVLIGSAQLALVLGTMAFEPAANLLGFHGGSQHDNGAIWGLLALMVSWVLTGSYLSIVHRLMIPAGMMYQSAWWAMVFQVTQFIAIMISALLRLGMLPTSLLFATSQIIVYVASGFYLKRTIPEFYPWLRSPDWRVGILDLTRAVFLSFSNVIQQGAFNGIVLLIAALAGPASVPIFTTVRTLTNLWTSVTTVLTTPFLPDVVRFHAKREVAKLAAINSAFWTLIGTAVNLGAVLSYPVIPFLYGLWTGRAVRLDIPLVCMMLASVVVSNAGGLMALHLNGINSLRIVFAASCVRALFGLGFGALGYAHLGLASFGVGILAGELTATGLLGRHFVRYELVAKGVRLSLRQYGPVLLGTGSALAFFVGSGFGWLGAASWFMALGGIVFSWFWGWKSLEFDMRTRLTSMALQWMPLR